MSDTKYQGWTNRETWNVALWLDNEESLYRECVEMARSAVDRNIDREDGNNIDRDSAVYEMSKDLENFVDQIAADLNMPTEGIFGDMILYAMARVDWREIAEHYIDDEIVQRSEAK